MAIDAIVYQRIEAELEKNNIDEMAEDILLELAELLADQNIINQELKSRIIIDETVITGVGRLEDDEEVIQVYLQSVFIGEKEYLIDDYIL